MLLPDCGEAAYSSSESAETDGDWQGSGTVLVVDDEDTVRAVATRLLDFLGFQTATATNGREALQIFPTIAEVSFVLLDLTMPHMDGQQTLRELRKLRPDVRVLIMSGFSAQEVAERFEKDGRVNFIQKPFNLAQVREKIRRLLT